MKGHSLKLFDTDEAKSRGLAERYRCFAAESVVDAIDGVDLVLICTPIKDTPQVIEGLGPLVEPRTVVCEIASLKGGTVPALRRLDGPALSIHPMFGPDVPSFSGLTMAQVPVKDGPGEAGLARTLFPETRLVQVTAESHDRAMAYVLSLPYFMNLAFAHALSSVEGNLVRDLAGSTFRVQSSIAGCIIGESPEFVEAIVSGNHYSWEAINGFMDEARFLRRLFRKGSGGVHGYCRGLRDQVEDAVILEARRLRSRILHESCGPTHI